MAMSRLEFWPSIALLVALAATPNLPCMEAADAVTTKHIEDCYDVDLISMLSSGAPPSCRIELTALDNQTLAEPIVCSDCTMDAIAGGEGGIVDLDCSNLPASIRLSLDPERRSWLVLEDTEEMCNHPTALAANPPSPGTGSVASRPTPGIGIVAARPPSSSAPPKQDQDPQPIRESTTIFESEQPFSIATSSAISAMVDPPCTGVMVLMAALAALKVTL